MLFRSQDAIESYFYKIEKIKEDLKNVIAGKNSHQNLYSLSNILRDKHKLKYGEDFIYEPTLARGLDYYTGTIFELKPTNDPASLSIGAGGRYDNLIGMFARREIPAVGFSFGIDRLIESLE